MGRSPAPLARAARPRRSPAPLARAARPRRLRAGRDRERAEATAERLIRAAGFDPVKAGGPAAAGRIEAPGGDLDQFGADGEVVDLDQARAAV
ncbi:hypothetical protein ATKI12_4507 [Kitasatospora sp. Ki12]